MNKIFEFVLGACDRLFVQRFQENESENLVKVGIAASIGAVVMACVATHKTEKIIEEVKPTVKENLDIFFDEESTEEEKKEAAKATGAVVLTAGAKITGLGVAVGIMEVISVKSFLRSNMIYKDEAERWKAEAVKWAGIAAGYFNTLMNYRKRVAERDGREAEEELYYGVRKETIQTMEDGKKIKKKVRMISGEPVNKNILLYAPWTSDKYVDEETYHCPGHNKETIKGVMKNVGLQINYWTDRFVSNNDIAGLLGIQKSVDWQTEGYVYGDAIHYSIREVYTEWEGKYIPVYYIELNSMLLTPERLNKALPYAPDYSAELEGSQYE